MTALQLLTALGGIDVDMLMEAELFGERKRYIGIWRVMAAALTCVILAIGAVVLTRPTPKTYALGYVTHQLVDEETVLLEEGNVWVYYVSADKIKKEYIKLPLDVENVFITWKHLSGIGDEVKLIGCSQNNVYVDSGTGYTREYIKENGERIILVISSEITEYINKSGAVLDSLDKTIGAYFGAETASNGTDAQTLPDAVTDKVTDTDKVTETDNVTQTDKDTETDNVTQTDKVTETDNVIQTDKVIDTEKTTEADTTRKEPETDASPSTESEVALPTPSPVDEALIGTIGDSGIITADHEVLSENKKAELYQTAVRAEANKNYQYAYGLYSYLTMQGYMDSGVRAWNLTAKAFAMPVIKVHKGTFDNFEDYYKSTDYGFLYADENGTPKFLYCVNVDGAWKTRTYTPDPYLRGVTSFYASEQCGVVKCVALNSDGSMQVFYDEDRYNNLSYNGYSVVDISISANICSQTKSALLGEFNVNRLIPKMPNGSYIGVLHTNKKIDYWQSLKWGNTTIRNDVGDEMLSDLVSITWGKQYPYGCTSDGRIVGADADIADIKNVRYAYMIDQNYIVSDGHAYYRNGGKGRYYYKKDAVFAVSNNCFISSDGRIYNSNDTTKYNAQNISCIYDLGCNKDFLYVISNEGKLLSVELTEGCGKSNFSGTDIMMIDELKNTKLFAR